MKYLNELFARVVAGESATNILRDLDPQNKGYIGEALLRVLVLLGVHPIGASSSVIPYRYTFNPRRINSVSDLSERIDILKNGLINTGASSGKIDVVWRDGSKVCVCSSKIGKTKFKSIADLEISAMLTEFTEGGGVTESGNKIPREAVVTYQLVKDKYEIECLSKKSKASNQVSKDNLNLLDIKDLDRMCATLLTRIKQCSSKDLEAIVNHLLSDTKPLLQTRFHQKLICLKVMRVIHNGIKTTLIGALPRSGKTYMGAFISKHFKKILIITTCPKETCPEWIEVFKRHRDFSEYDVKDLDSSSSENIASSNKNNKHMVAIASIQFFKKVKRDDLIGLDWDIVLIDEVHKGGSTELSNTMLDTYIGTKPIRVMMTATYTKPVEYYNIPSDCCFFWDLEDVRLMREWGEPAIFTRLCDKYGVSDVTTARDESYKSGETDDSIRHCYLNAPRLNIFTTIMHQDMYDNFCSLSGNIYGFSMRSLFMLTEDGKAFQNQGKIDEFLACISGSDYMTRYKKGNMSMNARIRRYWKTTGHRDYDEFMTQIWFLPYGVGQKISELKPIIMARINANSHYKNYDIHTLDSGLKMDGKKIDSFRKAVASMVVDAKANGKKGLILLTGNVGSLGVSLPEVDVAFILHDIDSADMTYQQMMRVLTEHMNKKCGIVVDFNVWRVLTTLNAYAASRCGKADRSSDDKIRWCLSHLIDVDPDLWNCIDSPETFPKETIADELTKQWRKMIERTSMSLMSLAQKVVDLGEDQAQLDLIATYSKTKTEAIRVQVNPEQEKLSSGIEVRCVKDDQRVKDELKEKDDVQIQRKANLNDILSRLIPIFSIFSGYEYGLLEAMECIESNDRYLRALNLFLVQLSGNIKMNSENIDKEKTMKGGHFHTLKKLVKNNYEKIKDARETFEVVSSRMSVIDNPEDLVTFLTQHLSPKEIEKKTNGEVFTPPCFIQEIFENFTLADPLIWSDPSKKFLDPANGIGNFPALAFHRLMDGLKDAIQDEAERKRHILENMLYMCELNSVNVEISRKIFDPEGIYDLKLYEGSYLDLDPEKEWGIKEFDVIFGNVPWQKQVGPRKTQPIWNLFVLKSIDALAKDGYLVFVHPSGWRSPEGAFRNVYEKIMENRLIYLNMNSFKKGREMFNVGSNFDYYVLQRSEARMNERDETSISDLNDKTMKINLKRWNFIPSGRFDLFKQVLASENEPTVKVLHDYSSYETRKAWMSKEKTGNHLHPCVYTITMRDGLNLLYSSEKKGHFGIPKVIWSNGLGTYPVIDEKGEFGLTQFSYAIIDTYENLVHIKNAMNNPLFIELMEYCKFTDHKYNYKVIRLLKKDFWEIFKDTHEEVKKTPTKIITDSVSKKNKNELIQMCKERKLKGYSKKTKAELIALLS